MHYKKDNSAVQPFHNRIWNYATSQGVPACSLRVAVIVGTLLNIVNQGDIIMSGGSIDWLKIGLTYMVPYGVSTHSAVAAKLRADKAQAKTF